MALQAGYPVDQLHVEAVPDNISQFVVMLRSTGYRLLWCYGKSLALPQPG